MKLNNIFNGTLPIVCKWDCEHSEEIRPVANIGGECKVNNYMEQWKEIACKLFIDSELCV